MNKPVRVLLAIATALAVLLAPAFPFARFGMTKWTGSVTNTAALDSGVQRVDGCSAVHVLAQAVTAAATNVTASICATASCATLSTLDTTASLTAGTTVLYSYSDGAAKPVPLWMKVTGTSGAAGTLTVWIYCFAGD